MARRRTWVAVPVVALAVSLMVAGYLLSQMSGGGSLWGAGRSMATSNAAAAADRKIEAMLPQSSSKATTTTTTTTTTPIIWKELKEDTQQLRKEMAELRSKFSEYFLKRFCCDWRDL